MINGKVSHWWQQVGVPAARPELPGALAADVAIVGAGFTGCGPRTTSSGSVPSCGSSLLSSVMRAMAPPDETEAG